MSCENCRNNCSCKSPCTKINLPSTNAGLNKKLTICASTILEYLAINQDSEYSIYASSKIELWIHQNLNAKDQQIIFYKFNKGYKIPQIAKAVKMPERQVKYRFDQIKHAILQNSTNLI